MNISIDKDYAYDYTISLCSAIEKFADYEESKDSQIFYCNGSNLRYALERALYFSYINNNAFYNIYINEQTNKSNSQIKVKTLFEKKLILYICANLQDIDIDVVDQKGKLAIKHFLSYILRKTKFEKIYDIYSKKFNTRDLQDHTRNIDIVFCIMNKKFVLYNNDIFNNLKGNNCSYFTFNKKTRILLESKNLPYYFQRIGTRFSRLFYSDSYLNQYGLSEQYDAILKFIVANKPRKIIIFEGNSSFDEVVNAACKTSGIECICIQQGWSPIIHNGFRNMTYSKMLVWGDGFSKLLAPYNKKQKFISTGSHTIECDRTQNRSHDHKLSVIFFVQEKSILFGDDGMSAFAELIRWIANTLPNIHILIAGKGVYQIAKSIEDLLNVELLSKAAETPLNEIIAKGDIVISSYSTVTLDAIASDKLPIVFNTTSLPKYYPDITKDKAGIEIKNLGDAKNIFRDISTEKMHLSEFSDGIQKFKKQYFACDKTQALKNIVAIIKS